MKKTINGLYGGIEVGGTKCICGIGTGPNDLSASEPIPTTTPRETIGRIVEFFKSHPCTEQLRAVGIASFGPLDLNPKSPTCGCIVGTPKAGWAGTNLVGLIRDALDLPVSIDTDVNGAALAEQKWGAARGLDSFIYLTVGTGIGGGGFINGKLMHGLIHPEMGHIRVPLDRADSFSGNCPFHQDCWEGLASGKAVEERWGCCPEEIPLTHPAWKLEAEYLSLGIVNLICILSPQRVILGGGVMKHPDLLPALRSRVRELLNNYIASLENIDNLARYLVPPGLGSMSGVLGAIALAEQLR